MPYTRSYVSTWLSPPQAGRGSGQDRFDVAFKLGPYQLFQAAIDLTIADLGELAISGEDVDLSSLHGKELLLRSVPDRLSWSVLCGDDSFIIYPYYNYDRCWVATEGDFEDYLASFSKTSRKGLKRRVKQLTLESGGKLDIRRFADSDMMDMFHRDARIISAKTFQEKLMNDGLPADEAFCREMEQKVRYEQCYGSILYLEGEPISYLFCERQGPGWLAVYGGFDPAYAKLSPGTVHLLSDLEDGFRDRYCKLFDFGPGRSNYKQFFATDRVPASDVLILKKTLRNRLIVETHRTLGFISRGIVNLADALNLKTLLRQRIRGR